MADIYLIAFLVLLVGCATAMWQHERRKRNALEGLPAWELTLAQAKLAQASLVPEKRLIERIVPYSTVLFHTVTIVSIISGLYLAWAPMHWFRPEPVLEYMEQKSEDPSTTLHNVQTSSVASVCRDSSMIDQSSYESSAFINCRFNSPTRSGP